MLGIDVDWLRLLLSPLPWWGSFALAMYATVRIIHWRYPE